MPSSELRLQEVTPARLESLVADHRCVRVGATRNVVSRANSYQNETFDGRPFVGVMFYTRARNAWMCENRLLSIASRCGTARFNVHRSSNFAQAPGYVYAIHARVRVPPGRRQGGCTIS